jgi:hypothetical protein
LQVGKGKPFINEFVPPKIWFTASTSALTLERDAKGDRSTVNPKLRADRLLLCTGWRVVRLRLGVVQWDTSELKIPCHRAMLPSALSQHSIVDKNQSIGFDVLKSASKGRIN